MFGSISKYRDIGILISRIGIGSSYIVVHGFRKLIGGPEKWESYGNAMKNFGIDFFPIFWGFMAAVSETIGGLLIIAGLFFRPAALLIFITMFVAAFRHYSNGDPLSKTAYPIEMAMIMILYFFIGAGKYSIDHKIWRID
ncbi:MAG: DoxX family protein [Ignavibacteriales bacterium]|nr:MAG: DoxX family protein [Ignavibacteriales bacterium]